MPVDDVNVLVVFYSRGGETERLAVSIAEGAVRAGARIKLRRAPDIAPEERIAADAAWQEARDRMHQKYATPRPAVRSGQMRSPSAHGPRRTSPRWSWMRIWNGLRSKVR